MIKYLKRLKSSKFVCVKAFPMYGGIGVSAPSLHRESTDSLIGIGNDFSTCTNRHCSRQAKEKLHTVLFHRYIPRETAQCSARIRKYAHELAMHSLRAPAEHMHVISRLKMVST